MAIMLMRLLVILFIVTILASLGSALFFMIRDRGNSNRTVKALTLRVIISIVLFLTLTISFHNGWITTRL